LKKSIKERTIDLDRINIEIGNETIQPFLDENAIRQAKTTMNKHVN